MRKEDIAAAVTAIADLMTVLAATDPADKAEIYAQLGLHVTNRPGEKRWSPE
jgi:hypothetical protein